MITLKLRTPENEGIERLYEMQTSSRNIHQKKEGDV